MQSGTTGINTIRMYNPYKQAMDQDPLAKFIKSQIPKVKNFPPAFFHNPPKKSLNVNLFDNEFQKEIINVKETAQYARKKIFDIRKSQEHKILAKNVYLKHGSRGIS